ncbi:MULTISPECIES: hypothetical protein [Enterococcus]|uniref:hypothetical protein n=1 Tax=Enterococcus TaxID=1350 RepID=UPI00137AD361|nr:hypothetical protein [Enterococcus diestrammenae]KAF1295433.1 hypothetical protein BAU18_02260 [Enterococcus diestrammenae]
MIDKELKKISSKNPEVSGIKWPIMPIFFTVLMLPYKKIVAGFTKQKGIKRLSIKQGGLVGGESLGL